MRYGPYSDSSLLHVGSNLCVLVKEEVKNMMAVVLESCDGRKWYVNAMK